MKITLTNIGKRFNREWIFREVNYTFVTGKKYAITGANGSGKSTLLQVIAGSAMHAEGKIEFSFNETKIEDTQQFREISIAAPYLELIEEMTTKEMISFHATFKQLILPEIEILQKVNLQDAANKQIRYYSSGMKQRLKLALAFFSNTPVLLLDEPTTNLDEDGISLYHQLIADYTGNKLVIVCSNDKQEYGFCGDVLEMGNFK